MSAVPTAAVTAPPPSTTETGRAVPWAAARMRAHRAARPAPPRRVPLHDAAGLTLAGDLRSLRPQPAFDTAAMDGYTVSGPPPWTVRGTACAGTAWQGVLGSGECVRISTGSLVPPGADAVVPVEVARSTGGRVFGTAPAEGRHIRRTGEDAAAGVCLAPAGTRIGPALLGLAAAAGHDTLPVRPRPRVAVLVTGDELDHSGVPEPGRVRDALGPLLPSLVAELGGETVALRHVPDHPHGELARAVRAVRAHGEAADVVVVTGSTSVGATDQLRGLLADGGARTVVDTVACRPGHPMLLAELAEPGELGELGSRRWVVGLPGNPYAALVSARTLLGPLLAGLSGRPLPRLPRLPVHGEAKGAPGGTRLVPVSWTDDGCRIAAGHRAAFLRGAAIGDALAALGPGWRDGSPAPVLLPWA
ncbi:molybdopterin molybdotransferase MoeA [Streptomyces sp. NPDC005805]|uniref:molybdopterin molybdotransferase MoeA n=1 Tax=Streptomyces sp. NPDC005805 TaxID=3157068 RepID=UPI0033E13D19